MAENSTSATGATSDQTGSETPEYVSKAELNATINGFRKSFLTDMKKELAELRAALPVQEEPPAKKAKVEADPEKEAIKQELRQLREARETDLAVARNLKMKEVLSETLTQNGVDPRHLKHAMAFLTLEGGVRMDEDGSVKMKLGALDYELNDAVKSWVKTEDAKLYLAPKGAAGSGQKGSVNSNQNPSGQMTKEVDWEAFKNKLLSGRTK